MATCNEPRRAIPVLISYLEYIRGRTGDDEYSWEWQANEHLFAAYLYTGNWQAAEKLLLQRQEPNIIHIGNDLPRVALVAAQTGAIDEAVRLWRTRANLDRRRLEGLSELAATKAKEPLRLMYTQMKKRDPLSAAVDKALKILQ
jgi:hypothetical protein